MRASPLFILSVLAAVLLAPAALAGGPTFAIHAGKIYTASADGPAVIEHGYVYVRDGKVAAVGTDIDIPRGVRVIDMPDAVVMPGLVAASSRMTSERASAESIGAAFKAADAVDVYADSREMLEAGVTITHYAPSDRYLVAGQGAVVRHLGAAGSEVLLASSDLSLNLNDNADNPAPLEQFLVPPSANSMIKPSVRQRPGGRIERNLALKEAIDLALTSPATIHDFALARAWERNTPLRVNAETSGDLLGALAFLETHNHRAYIVGGAEAAKVAGRIEASNTPLVYTIESGLFGASNIGNDPDAYQPDVSDLAKLENLTLALATDWNEPARALRLAAATALRGGMDEERVIEAITRVPAELLGVGDRVGSIEPGKDADLLVLSGAPLAPASSVSRVYIAGELAFEAEHSGAVIVRAGTLWLGPGNEIEGGEVLIEDGKIAAVGKRVGVPGGARFIDAGAGSFVAPGMIDGFGHLGLEGDASSIGPEISLASLAGAPTPSESRVAGAGVTTTIRAPYDFDSKGSRLSAVKTGSSDRDTRVVADIAALAFDIRSLDPAQIGERLQSRIDGGKQYLEKWNTWREEHEKWKKARAAGTQVDTEPKVEETASEDTGPDPLTGTWQVSISGGPLPNAIAGPVGINLEGDEFEGRVLHPRAAEIEHRIIGTLDGDEVQGTFEIETGGQGYPTFSGTLSGETFSGTMNFQGIDVTLEGERTSKDAVTFSVGKGKRRTTGKNGEPLKPAIDPELEPIRAVLEGRAPMVVRADTAQQIDTVLDVVVDKNGLKLVLLGGEASREHAARLKDAGVGVIVPTDIRRRENRRGFERSYVQSVDLTRSGVPIAFQSGAEDGARGLPMLALHAVAAGLGPDEALEALTSGAAKIYGIDDRVGSIEVGKDGDLVVYTGHPLEPGSRVERVIIGGESLLPDARAHEGGRR